MDTPFDTTRVSSVPRRLIGRLCIFAATSSNSEFNNILQKAFTFQTTPESFHAINLIDEFLVSPSLGKEKPEYYHRHLR
jgi:hypothetical protein